MQSNRSLIVEPVGLQVDTLPKPLNWTDKGLEDAEKAMLRIQRALGKARELLQGASSSPGEAGASLQTSAPE